MATSTSVTAFNLGHWFNVATITNTVSSTTTFGIKVSNAFVDDTATVITGNFFLNVLDPSTKKVERIFVPASGVSADGLTIGVQTTGEVERGLKPTGNDPLDGDPSLYGFKLRPGMIVAAAVDPIILTEFQLAHLGTIGSTIKHNARPGYMGSGISSMRVFADATARDAAITSPANGDVCYLTDTGVMNQFISGAWTTFATGTTANASETVAGKVEMATSAEVTAGTAAGSTGALLVVPNDNATITEAVTFFESTNITGAEAETLTDASNADALHTHDFGTKFGGTGADGVQGDAALTITGSNNTVIEKNFTSWTAGSVARTATITPTGGITIIKVSGNADFTNWTFDWDGKGALGASSAGVTSAGSAGTSASALIVEAINAGTGGTVGNAGFGNGGDGGGGAASYFTAGSNGSVSGGGGTAGTGGAAPSVIYPISGTVARRAIFIGAGAGGGGGGGGGDGGGNTGGTGGAGGAGGGCLIIEVAGNITFSTTTLSADGANGSVGGNGTVGNGDGGGGGGGGAGGSVLILYNGTKTGSPTITTTAGSAGSGGSPIGGGESGGAGGAGGVGSSATILNTSFA